MSILSDLMATGFSAGEAIQLLALVSGEADGVFIDLHVTNDAVIDGELSASFISTGAITLRSLANRGSDFVNVKDYGATLNGTTFDGNAINAALAKIAIRPDRAVFFPSGGTSFAGITTTPSTPVHWILDGVTSGVTTVPIQQFQRTNLGDLVENYHNGQKVYFKTSANVDSPGILRVDYRLDQAGGSDGVISVPISVNAQDNAGAVTSMWGINVAMDSYSNESPWPQNVGINSTVNKRGSAWAAGMHITAADFQNLPTSTGGPIQGFEIGVHAFNADDAFSGTTWGNVGIRAGMHIALQTQVGVVGGVTPGEFASGIIFTVASDALVDSIIGVGIDSPIYQVIDSRGAIAPGGYADPVAAVRMLTGQIIDFNGGAALNSAAGNYLQYTATGTARLRYMAGATEAASIGSTGNGIFAGTLKAGGALVLPAPVTKNADFTMGATETTVICNGGGTITVTLPSAASSTGQVRRISTIAAFTVVSVSSNVVPLAGGAAGTAILAATAGKWATLQSDGTNWVITAGN